MNSFSSIEKTRMQNAKKQDIFDRLHFDMILSKIISGRFQDFIKVIFVLSTIIILYAVYYNTICEIQIVVLTSFRTAMQFPIIKSILLLLGTNITIKNHKNDLAKFVYFSFKAIYFEIVIISRL